MDHEGDTGLQASTVKEGMDSLDDMDFEFDSEFDLDFDPQEVVRQAKDVSSPETFPVPHQRHLESAVNKITHQAMQHEEGTASLRAPSDEKSVGSFNHVHDTVSEEIQHAEGLNLQAAFQEHVRSTELVDDFLPDKVIQEAERDFSHQAAFDDQYKDLLDDIVFEETIHTERGFGVSHLPNQRPKSSLESPVSQQATQDAGCAVNHHHSADEAPRYASTEPVIGGVQCSYNSSHACAAADNPECESPEDMALSEAIQYAYDNDLTTDYLRESSSITRLFGPLVQSICLSTTEDGFTDHSRLPDVDIPNPKVLDKVNTLTITPCALRLITEARAVQREEVIQSLTEEVCKPDKFKPKKLELPILRTENYRDVREFRKQSTVCPDALLRSIKKHRLPLYPQNLEEGEGMESSSMTRAESEKMMKKSEEEKLSVTKYTLTYLVNQLKDHYVIEDQIDYMVGEIKYEKARTSQFPLV